MPLLTKTLGPEKIAWSINGTPVNLEWDSISMVAPGGYDQLRGTVQGKGNKRLLKQGARVQGVRPNGKTLWLGTLVAVPKVLNNVASIEAEGYKAIAMRRTRRLPYIISDASQWSNADELPFDYTNNQKFTLQSKGNGLGWIISNSATYGANDRAGYGLYVPGYTVQRLRANIRKTGDNTNFDIEVRDADDLGAASVVTTKTLGAGTADGDLWNVNAVNQNTVLVNVICNTGTSPGANVRVTLQTIQACVIADDNDWTTSDVVSDVASRLSFADNVQESPTEIQSLDWTSGWDELLTYMAAIEDYTWLITEDTTKGARKDAMLTFRPWGNKTWQTNMDMSDASGLSVLPYYNSVTVKYERPAGVAQHKTYQPGDFNLDDPIATLTYEYPDPPTLENTQRNTNLADQIGERLLRRTLTTRLSGSIKVGQLRKGVPWDIKAGDLLDVQGFNPVVKPQRITQVTYQSDGTVNCSLERSWDVAALLFKLQTRRKRTTPHAWGPGHRG